jgi:hypothetical protein
MASLNETFAAQDMPAGNGNFEPLPAGWYTATITGAQLKFTKSGTGEYIAIRYDIKGPTHSGRVVFGNLNIRNQNPKAEEIGRQQFGDLMRSCGLAKVNDTDQLIGNDLQIKLGVERSEQYGDRNDVKGFKPNEGGFKAASAIPAATPAAAAAPAKAAPPWARK